MATRICVFIGFLVACSMERLGENLEWSDSKSSSSFSRVFPPPLKVIGKRKKKEGIKDVREREREREGSIERRDTK